VTTALGRLFHAHFPLVKNLFLTPSLTLPCHSSKTFPHVLSLSPERGDQYCPFAPLWRELQKFAVILLLSVLILFEIYDDKCL